MEDKGLSLDQVRSFDHEGLHITAESEGAVYVKLTEPYDEVTKYIEDEPQQLELFQPLEEPVDLLPLTMNHYQPFAIQHIGSRGHSKSRVPSQHKYLGGRRA